MCVCVCVCVCVCMGGVLVGKNNTNIRSRRSSRTPPPSPSRHPISCHHVMGRFKTQCNQLRELIDKSQSVLCEKIDKNSLNKDFFKISSEVKCVTFLKRKSHTNLDLLMTFDRVTLG